MPQSILIRILIPFTLLFVTLVIFFVLLRKRRDEKEKERVEKLREDLDRISKLKNEELETSEEDKELLDELVERVREAEEKGGNKVELPFGENVEIDIEAPDVLSLKTSKGKLFKSFDSVRFQKIEGTENGFELHIT